MGVSYGNISSLGETKPNAPLLNLSIIALTFCLTLSLLLGSSHNFINNIFSHYLKK